MFIEMMIIELDQSKHEGKKFTNQKVSIEAEIDNHNLQIMKSLSVRNR